jgi:hypothetical protein
MHTYIHIYIFLDLIAFTSPKDQLHKLFNPKKVCFPQIFRPKLIHDFVFQHPYFPPPFPQQTAQDVFAQNPHLAAAAADPYNVNSLHSFQTSQVRLAPEPSEAHP